MKISALTAATTPLSGAELFPIVQSGNTRRVSLNDLLRSIGNGTAAAPALAPGGDPNTGIYFPAADTIGFVEGGVEVARFDQNGYFGIGNTVMSAMNSANGAGNLVVGTGVSYEGMTVYSGAASYGVLFFADGTTGTDAYAGGLEYNHNIDTMYFRTNAVLRWRINQNGHFIADTDNTYDIGGVSSNRPRNLYVAGNLAVDTDTLFVDATNNRVGIGTTSPSSGYGLHVVGGTRVVASGGSRAGTFEGPSASVGSGNAQLHIASTDPAAADAGGILRFTANTIPAANFPVATIAGRHQTLAAGNYSGYLQFNVATAGGGVAERMRIDSTGNLGLGVTPSAWAGSYRAVEISSASAFAAAGSDINVLSNAFNDGTNWIYKATGPASFYRQLAGAHTWFTAPSGTAGNAITFTTAMTLDASGRLGIGVTVPNEALSVRRDGGDIFTARLRNASSAVNARAAILFQNDVGETGFLGAHSSTAGTGIGFPDRIVLQSQTANGLHFVASNASGAIQFNTGGTASANLRWWISNSGHLLTGTDNTVDIGASAATRPRDLHLARNLVGAGWVRAGAASAGAASTTTIGGTTATTVGAAGAASALPANPLGYIVAHVGTTEVRIPYYNA